MHDVAGAPAAGDMPRGGGGGGGRSSASSRRHMVAVYNYDARPTPADRHAAEVLYSRRHATTLAHPLPRMAGGGGRPLAKRVTRFLLNFQNV